MILKRQEDEKKPEVELSPFIMLYTTMGPNVMKVIKVLFISFFLFYAVSPLSCLSHPSSESSAITGKAKYGPKGLSLFLGELIWSKIFHEKEPAGSADNNRLLIKKARAITNSNKDVTKLKDGYAISDWNFPVFSSTLLCTVIFEYPHLYHFHLYREFTGLSPPFA